MSFETADGDASQRVVTLTNRQRDRRIDSVYLQRLVHFHLQSQLGLSRYDLAINLLSAARMAEANETHLKHKGPTDVITFDYGEPGDGGLHGELLVCPAVAVEQAQDYGTTWELELMRYIIHGVLHLRGYDDRALAARRVMKREEDRLLELLAGVQSIRRLGRRLGTS